MTLVGSQAKALARFRERPSHRRTAVTKVEKRRGATAKAFTHRKSTTLAVIALLVGGLGAVTSLPVHAAPTFTNYTTANGLGSNTVYGVYTVGSTIYAATSGGLSISTNGGTSFTNRTTTDGLGGSFVRGVYANGSTVYAATSSGLSISTNGGATFTNRDNAGGSGIGGPNVLGVYAVGTTVYAATISGLSISTNGGTNFTNRTTANGLGNNTMWGVLVVGSTIYAATDGGLSISTDGGTNFTNYTIVNGLGNNVVFGVFVDGSTVYAATSGGLSISVGSGSGSQRDASPPAPVIQQFGKPASGVCDSAAPESLNWSSVASSGWSESWAQWVNGGNGGGVCTRTLVYSTAQSRWVVG